MKSATASEINASLERLASTYEVCVPVLLTDGTRSIASLGSGPLALSGLPILTKPTALFFPQAEKVLTFVPAGETHVPGPPEKPVLVIGFTARDIGALEFIDRFFATGFRDDRYFRRRDGAVVVAVTGQCGPNGQFQRLAGGNCDLELIARGQRYLIKDYSETGRTLKERMNGKEESASFYEFQDMSEDSYDEDLQVLYKASELIRENRVTEDFWSGIAARCIGCASCVHICPTCTCFDLRDVICHDRVERWRLWDSCLSDRFMREAGGRNPMGTEASRIRRRICHKLVADVLRWGHLTCFLCGRCDQVCPTGLGMMAVARELVANFG